MSSPAGLHDGHGLSPLLHITHTVSSSFTNALVRLPLFPRRFCFLPISISHFLIRRAMHIRRCSYPTADPSAVTSHLQPHSTAGVLIDSPTAQPFYSLSFAWFTLKKRTSIANISPAWLKDGFCDKNPALIPCSPGEGGIPTLYIQASSSGKMVVIIAATIRRVSIARRLSLFFSLPPG